MEFVYKLHMIICILFLYIVMIIYVISDNNFDLRRNKLFHDGCANAVTRYI